MIVIFQLVYARSTLRFVLISLLKHNIAKSSQKMTDAFTQWTDIVLTYTLDDLDVYQ